MNSRGCPLTGAVPGNVSARPGLRPAEGGTSARQAGPDNAHPVRSRLDILVLPLQGWMLLVRRFRRLHLRLLALLPSGEGCGCGIEAAPPSGCPESRKVGPGSTRVLIWNGVEAVPTDGSWGGQPEPPDPCLSDDEGRGPAFALSGFLLCSARRW